MAKLTSVFKVDLPEPFLWEYSGRIPDGQRMNIEDRILAINLNGFHAEIEFSEFGNSGKGTANSTLMATEITSIVLRITRSEDELPPIIQPDLDGRVDWTPLQEYLQRLDEKYRPVAILLLERLFSFFRYKAGHPISNIQPILSQSSFLNPVWINEEGDTVWDRKHWFECRGGLSIKLYPHLGVTAYNPDLREQLLEFLETPYEQQLYEEILSDAKIAIAKGNVRRAVLELAIACEVAIKQVYFESEKYRESDFAYYKKKKLVKDHTLEYLDTIALRTFGDSVKENDRECYTSVDTLFRCRNSVAHHGRAIFKNDSGYETQASETHLHEWWIAVRQAIRYIKVYSENT